MRDWSPILTVVLEETKVRSISSLLYGGLVAHGRVGVSQQIACATHVATAVSSQHVSNKISSESIDRVTHVSKTVMARSAIDGDVSYGLKAG